MPGEGADGDNEGNNDDASDQEDDGLSQNGEGGDCGEDANNVHRLGVLPDFRYAKAQLADDGDRAVRKYMRKFPSTLTKTDPIQLWVDSAGASFDSDGKKYYHEGLFCLLCCMAWEELSTKGGQQKTADQYAMLDTYFTSSVDALETKEYFRTQILEKLGFDGTLPPKFAVYVNNKRGGFTAKQLQAHAGAGFSEAEQARRAFGLVVYQTAAAARKVICDCANPLWIKRENWKSGEGAMTIVVAVLEALYWIRMRKNAEEAARKAANVAAGKGHSSTTWGKLKDNEQENLIKVKLLESTARKPFKVSDFPSYYLALFVVGMPIICLGEKPSHVLSTLSSGAQLTTSREEGATVDGNVYDSSSKVLRNLRAHTASIKAMAAARAGGDSPASSIYGDSSSGGRQVMTLMHNFSRQEEGAGYRLHLLKEKAAALETLLANVGPDHPMRSLLQAQQIEALLAIVAETTVCLAPPAPLSTPVATTSANIGNDGMLTAAATARFAAMSGVPQVARVPPPRSSATGRPCGCGKPHVLVKDTIHRCSSPTCSAMFVSGNPDICKIVAENEEGGGKVWCDEHCARLSGFDVSAKRRKLEDQRRAAYDEDMREFKARITEWEQQTGLRPVECGGAGDCFYKSVSRLLGYRWSWQQVREMMAVWVEDPTHHIYGTPALSEEAMTRDMEVEDASFCMIDSGAYGMSRTELAASFRTAGKYVEIITVTQLVFEQCFPNHRLNVYVFPPDADQLRKFRETKGSSKRPSGSVPNDPRYLCGGNGLMSERSEGTTLNVVSKPDHFQAGFGLSRLPAAGAPLHPPASFAGDQCDVCKKSLTNRVTCFCCKGKVHAPSSRFLCSHHGVLDYTASNVEGVHFCVGCFQNLGEPAEPYIATVHPDDLVTLQKAYAIVKSNSISV